jgi:hypothetical protein
MGWVMDLNDYAKNRAATKWGEPPYGHAKLAETGIAARPDDTLKAIAERAGLGPHDLYARLRALSR